MLAEAWTERMKAFYAISLGDKKIGHDFTAEEVSRVTNSSAFEDARAQASGKARARFDAVAQMAPQAVR